jgi:HAD superfamily hydrolase (TIGR01509 family)
MIDLIIFDCDGVLIDSEVIANRVKAEELRQLGYVITTEQMIDRFAGISERETDDAIHNESGLLLTDTHRRRVQERILSEFRADLKPIDGMSQVLSQLRIPHCVASSSSLERIQLALTTTKLIGYFEPNLFSAHMVDRGKPAPDLFLLAAAKMGMPPHTCLVIEDSVPGVQAAKAAGMRVFGFYGASHCNASHRERLQSHGADLVFSDMRQLPTLIIAFQVKTTAGGDSLSG